MKKNLHLHNFVNDVSICVMRNVVPILAYIFDSLRAGWFGDRIPVRVRFSAPVWTGPGPTQPPIKWIMGVFPRSKADGAWL
jgi:hypothetical protein